MSHRPDPAHDPAHDHRHDEGEVHEHDLGLQHDLGTLRRRGLGRRGMLGIFGGLGVAAVAVGCGTVVHGRHLHLDPPRAAGGRRRARGRGSDGR